MPAYTKFPLKEIFLHAPHQTCLLSGISPLWSTVVTKFNFNNMISWKNKLLKMQIQNVI